MEDLELVPLEEIDGLEGRGLGVAVAIGVEVADVVADAVAVAEKTGGGGGFGTPLEPTVAAGVVVVAGSRVAVGEATCVAVTPGSGVMVA